MEAAHTVERQADKLEQLAEEVFALSKLASAVRARRTHDTLSETEFLTLDALVAEGPMTVGAIQRWIGVRPAQMSRLVRSLEGKVAGGLVSCSINAKDRRKVDVVPTDAGRAAHEAYRAARVQMTLSILGDLSPHDREEFIRILRQIRETMANGTRRSGSAARKPRGAAR